MSKEWLSDMAAAFWAGFRDSITFGPIRRVIKQAKG